MRALSLVFTGDSFITARLSSWRDAGFRRLVSILRSSDLSFTNLEVLINDFEGIPAAYSGGTYAAARGFAADELKWMGFSLVSRANNHAMDYGVEGMKRTDYHLSRVGLSWSGVGMNLGEARSPAYLDVSGMRVSLVSATTSFPPGSEAGEQRPDMRGRPGVNAIRVRTVYQVSEHTAALLRRVAGRLGLKIHGKREFMLFDRRFRVGGEDRVYMEPAERDVEANLRQVSSASRQSDIVLFSLHSHQAVRPAESTPDFLRSMAHRIIDSGASAFIGHGPHVLRGLEIYRGRPIMYSLGNLIFQNDLVERQPWDLYYRFGLGLDATPADLYDAREKGSEEMRLRGFRWFTHEWRYWVTVAVKAEFDVDGEAKSMYLYPIALTWRTPRSRRGRPRLTRGRAAKRILEHVERLSKPLGTELKIREEYAEILF